MRSNKRTVSISIALAAVVGVIIFLAFGLQNASQTQSITGPTQKDLLQARPATPPAQLSKADVQQVLTGMQLHKIKESTKGTKTVSTVANSTLVEDKTSSVSLSLYNTTRAGRDVIAAVMTNVGSAQVTIDQLIIEGDQHCTVGPDCVVVSLMRPVVSTIPNPVYAPTTNSTITLNPHESLTAYIQPELNQDAYAAGGCYWYDIKDPSTHYCISTAPAAWLR